MIRAYHGSDNLFDRFQYQVKIEERVRERHDSDGPGLYFASPLDAVRQFGRIIYTVDLRLAHAVPTRGKVCLAEAVQLMRELNRDERDEVFSDWDENPRRGEDNFLATLAKRDPNDAFQQIWYDVFYRGGYTDRYLAGMKKLGYDGIIFDKGSDIFHYVMFSGDDVRIISIDQGTD